MHRLVRYFYIVFVSIVSVAQVKSFAYAEQSDLSNTAVKAVVKQVMSYEAAVTTFRDAFQSYPGDMPSAGERLVGCTGFQGKNCNPYSAEAGNNIIGNPAFGLTLEPPVIGQVRVPAKSMEDETVLFWAHLFFANLITGVDGSGINPDAPVTFGTVFPAAETGGGFIAGYWNGAPLSISLAPANKGMKGTVLVLISDEVLRGSPLNKVGHQALSPQDAKAIDRRMDDGYPNSGFVQAYGSSRCFHEQKPVYSEIVTTKECGLIFRIQG